ncbi:F0F1-type ATP synthase assembly protein I [Tumebacillus sp. BK434]|uniref:AtpZ/AtpI family protein n=1 Tax=Tumebacillus sp. BK434 TaxID=2512169 RepID=UPI0010521D68|nr:AtpZ/AtpI family protein [Tumebacillus sp. BK434]TCP55629.1 F0F1-type ATP synthase assembly protein I [Tumebacillus sp. BK434]
MNKQEEQQQEQEQKREQNVKHGEKNEAWRAFGLVSAIGLDLAICTIGGTVLGNWLDGWLGTSPWLLLLGIMLGLTAGIYGITKLIAVFQPEQKE